ncbi:uncharacterized protein MONBRDRAFT_28239, partial [Monosiga brevicollis MX1]
MCVCVYVCVCHFILLLEVGGVNGMAAAVGAQRQPPTAIQIARLFPRAENQTPLSLSPLSPSLSLSPCLGRLPIKKKTVWPRFAHQNRAPNSPHRARIMATRRPLTTGLGCVGLVLFLMCTTSAHAQAVYCAYGQVYNITNGTCEDCAPGTFKNSGSHRDTFCDICTSTTYSPHPGMRYCWQCPAGHVPNSERNGCDPCSPGSYSRSGASSCTLCPRGTFQPLSGQSSCTACPKGKFQNEEGHGSCINCPAGIYNDQTGRSSCKLCGNGYYSPSPNAASCLRCPAGWYQDGTTSDRCTICPSGTYTPSWGYGICRDCSTRTYMPHNGGIECYRTPSGYTVTTTGASELETCPAGQVAYSIGYPCYDIPSGREGVAYGAETPFTYYDCRPGTYQNISDPMRVCASCPPGTYQSNSRQTSCNECPVGKFTDRPKQRTCRSYTTVPAGQYIAAPATATSDHVLAPCPAGMGYCQYDVGMSCEPGQYYTGSSCSTCSSGKWTAEVDAHTCAGVVSCPTGYLQVQTYSATSDRLCEACPPGTYTDNTNPTSCKPVSEASDDYTDYPAAHYPMRGIDCVSGSYISVNATSSSSRECAVCPNGTFTSTSNAYACTPHTVCLPGQYVNRIGDNRYDRLCLDCGNNTILLTDDINMERCVPPTLCEPGYGEVVAPTPSSNRVCAPCELGVTFRNDSSATDACEPVRPECPPGEGFLAPASTSNDRQEMTRCIYGYDDYGEPCTCQVGCNRCYRNTNSSIDYLLYHYNGIPSASENTPSYPACIRPPGNELASTPADELVVACADVCRNDTNCRGFQIYLRDQIPSLRGSCCFKSSFDTGSSQEAIGIDFYEMEGCYECRSNYYRDGQHCQPLSDVPDVHVADSVLAMPIDYPEGGTVVTFNLTRVPGLNYTFSITAFESNILTESDFYLDNDQATLITLTNLSAVGFTSLTVQVTDNQTVCYQIIDGRVRKVLGGCSTEISLELTVVGFLSCPEDIIHYIPLAVTEEEVVWEVPRIPATATTVSVVGNTNQTVFAAGLYYIHYETTPLTTGDTLVCAFNITAINGFSQTAEYLRFENLGNGVAIDYVMEDTVYDRRMLRPEAFQGSLERESFAYGVYSPFATPFIYRPQASVSTVLHIRLAWCSTGNTLDLEELTPSPVSVRLAGARSVTFTDLGSGISPDLGCFLIWAQSSPITTAISFSRIDIALPLQVNIDDDVAEPDNVTVARRSTSGETLQLYSPISPSGIYMQHETSPGASDATSTLLVLEDILPPEWVGCPVEAVVVNVESGVEMVSVSWIEPQATDNIGIASIEANFRPGDNFTWIDSPYEIVYTAYDFSEQQAECRFDVIVQPNLNPLSLDTPFRTVFSRSVTIQSGFPYADDLQVLMDPTAAVLSFDSDFDNTTALEVRFAASNNDVIEVRARDDSQYSQFVVSLDWTATPEAADLAAAHQVEVSAEIEFDQFTRDPSATFSSSDLTATAILYDATCHVDAVTGRILVKGLTQPFTHGFMFRGVTIRLKFPRGATITNGSTAPLLSYTLSSASYFGLRHRISAAVASAYDANTAEPFILVFDNTPPTFLTCPESATKRTQAGEAAAIFNWSLPIYTDNRPIGLRLLQRAYYTDGVFTGALGTNMSVPIRDPTSSALIVEYVARDEYGNRAYCNFTLLSQDGEAPVAVCPTGLNYILRPGRGDYD